MFKVMNREKHATNHKSTWSISQINGWKPKLEEMKNEEYKEKLKHFNE